ncbi:hypothetical protein [Alteribacter aurantiacus]|uniref:hypothetical protein n=1 Tax=Alteribacter aurantiacus TaxID=254410 RepID=UPI0004244B21|nr:hypothetical protein [Alteribacter aurantiacus]
MFFTFRGGAGEPPRAKPLRGLSWLPRPQESANIPATPDHMSKFISFVIEISEMKCIKELRESAEEFFQTSTSPIKEITYSINTQQSFGVNVGSAKRRIARHLFKC